MDQDTKIQEESGSAASRIGKLCAGAISVVCILWSVDTPRHLGFALQKEQFLAPILGLGIAVCFLVVRWNGQESRRTPWYDYVLALGGLVTLLHVGISYPRLLNSVADRTPEHIAVGTITILLVMEGLRRAVGWFLFCLIMLFVLYALVAHLVPGDLQGINVPIDHLVLYLGFDPSAVYSSPLTVAATVVVLFILMGQALFAAGGGEFFTDLSMATMGKTRGGSAKIAVMASALFGSISGSAVANVATTGIITIPMMRRGGYSAVDAGAVESIASTGGQLTPPIMGAAAFLMAEFLEVPYSDIMLVAILPAFLYYLSVFVQVDLIAARDALRPVDQTVPRTAQVMKEGWHFILPFVVLLYALFELNMPPIEAALYSVLAILAVGTTRAYKGHRLRVAQWAGLLSSTGLGTFRLILIVAAAGFVIGILNITGLGFGLTLALVKVAGSSLIAILLISAVICIVLGMGMPTSGVYVLLAALVAPAIVETGAPAIAAHMFIFYFGMLSMITPPIAIAAFTAATLSGASPMATGFAAVRIGWVAYIVPFLFVFSPTLLLLGDTVHVVLDLITASAGVYLTTAALVGYVASRLSAAVRLALAAAGLAAMTPLSLVPHAEYVTAFGLAVGAAICVWSILEGRRAAAVAR